MSDRGSRIMFVGIVAFLVAMMATHSLIYPPNAPVSPPNQTVTGRTSSADGIRFWVALNTTTITTGQELNVTTAMTNTLPESNSVPTANPGNWSIGGFPVAIWPVCAFTLPIEFVVLRGNSSLSGLQGMGSNFTAGYICMEGWTVDNIVFNPRSDVATLVGTYQAAEAVPNQTLGPYVLATNFTVSGYWDYPLTSAEAEDLYTHADGGVTFAYPEVLPTPAHAFAPGVYTLATADEWGQAVVLHFTVFPVSTMPPH